MTCGATNATGQKDCTMVSGHAGPHRCATFYLTPEGAKIPFTHTWDGDYRQLVGDPDPVLWSDGDV